MVITTRPVEILSHYSGLSLAVSLIHKMTKDKKKGGGGQQVTLEWGYSQRRKMIAKSTLEIFLKKKKEDNQMNYIRQYDFFLSNPPKNRTQYLKK